MKTHFTQPDCLRPGYYSNTVRSEIAIEPSRPEFSRRWSIE